MSGQAINTFSLSKSILRTPYAHRYAILGTLKKEHVPPMSKAVAVTTPEQPNQLNFGWFWCHLTAEQVVLRNIIIEHDAMKEEVLDFDDTKCAIGITSYRVTTCGPMCKNYGRSFIA